MVSPKLLRWSHIEAMVLCCCVTSLSSCCSYSHCTISWMKIIQTWKSIAFFWSCCREVWGNNLGITRLLLGLDQSPQYVTEAYPKTWYHDQLKRIYRHSENQTKTLISCDVNIEKFDEIGYNLSVASSRSEPSVCDRSMAVLWSAEENLQTWGGGGSPKITQTNNNNNKNL